MLHWLNIPKGGETEGNNERWALERGEVDDGMINKFIKSKDEIMIRIVYIELDFYFMHEWILYLISFE